MTAQILDLSWAAYRALDKVNISSLIELDRSPQHYKFAVEEGRPDTPTLALGRTLHTCVLEPERFEREVVAWTGGRRAGKEWQAFVERNDGRIILKPDELEMHLDVREAVHTHPFAGRLLTLGHGLAEATIAWTHDETGIECKSRLDWIDTPGNFVADLKTARDATPGAFGRSATSLHYCTKAAFYADAAEAVTGKRSTYYLIAVEKVPPYAVAVYRVTDEQLHVGRVHYRGLLRKLRECRDADSWPGPCEGAVADLLLPPWAYQVEEDVVIEWPDGERTHI